MDSPINEFLPTLPQLLIFVPEIILVVAAILVLVVDAIMPKSRSRVGHLVASIALVISIIASMLVSSSAETVFAQAGMGAKLPAVFSFAPLGLVCGAVLGLCGLLAVHVADTVRVRTEFSSHISNHLILVATAAAMALLKASNLIAFFVLLETLTVTLYALVGSYRKSVPSLEAAVKYLIAGGVSGAIMLFGIVLIYGSASLYGNAGDPLSYVAVRELLATHQNSVLPLVGAGMILVGIMFKFGIFPMQFWIPDTYQGAPLHVTFLLATLSKATGFFLMLVFIEIVFEPIFPVLFPVLLVLTLISMIYANTTALGQQRVKRLIGLSGVSHASYMMLAILALARLSYGDFTREFHEAADLALFLYIIVYILTLYPVFATMARIQTRTGDEAFLDFDDFRGLAKRSPLLAGALASGLSSLAGIPPTVGFIAKLALLIIVFAAELYVPAIIMLICVVASIYYYFGWFRSAFSTDGIPEEVQNCEILKPAFTSRISLLFFSALILVGGIIYFAVLNLL